MTIIIIIITSLFLPHLSLKPPAVSLMAPRYHVLQLLLVLVPAAADESIGHLFLLINHQLLTSAAKCSNGCCKQGFRRIGILHLSGG